MKLGLFAINSGRFATDPGTAVDVALAIEAAGWESVWTGEHYVLPDPPTPDSPARPDTAMLDPFIALAHVAARTTTLKVATGVTVLPLHQPFALAKQVVSLDRVSGGRLLFGVGVGYLGPEFAAFGIDRATRGRRTDELLDALRTIWTAPEPITALDGRTFPGVRAEPRPTTPQGPPVHIGGHVPASFRRAVARGAGWYGYALDVDAAEKAIAGVRSAEGQVERPTELGRLEITITPARGLAVDAALVDRYASLGVDRLVLLPTRDLAGEPDAVADYAGRLADLANP